jgi:hypothetical protein
MPTILYTTYVSDDVLMPSIFDACLDLNGPTNRLKKEQGATWLICTIDEDHTLDSEMQVKDYDVKAALDRKILPDNDMDNVLVF